MKLPVFKAFGASFAVAYGHFGEMLKILWLPMVLLSAAAFWFMGPVFRVMEQMQELQASGAPPDPHELMRVMVPMFSWFGIGLLVQAIFFPMIFAGVLRYVIRGERPKSFFYLQFGRDELRILITLILAALIVFGVYVVGVILIGALGFGLGFGGLTKSSATLLLGLVGLALLIFLIWIMLRLSLAVPAAIGARKIGIGPSWSLAKGNVWRLLLYWILWLIVCVVVEAIWISIMVPGYFEHYVNLMQIAASHPGDPAAVQQASLGWQRMMMVRLQSRMPLMLGMGCVVGLVLYPLLISSGGVAYRLMTEKKDEDAEPVVSG